MSAKVQSQSNLTTAAKMAKELGLKPGAVRQALKQLNLKPTVVKAGCAYYDASIVQKIKSTLK